MSPSGSARVAIDVDAVTALVEHVAATVVAPRFRQLRDGDVSEKAPGDVVTVVDTEAEAVLTAGLGDLAPGVPVIGEEAASADPDLLRGLDSGRQVFVVDPIDGTRAFIDGSPEYAVMVALVEDGEATASWIRLPALDQTFVAVRGDGAWLDGQRLTRPPPAADLGDLRGGIATWQLPAAERAVVTSRAADFGPGVSMRRPIWSGYSYAQLATGAIDFLVHWQTWPWDHAPGAVLLREVGGVSRRLDGRDYRPGVPQDGLLVAADDASWHQIHTALNFPA